jgi:hypothetical protein
MTVAEADRLIGRYLDFFNRQAGRIRSLVRERRPTLTSIR